MGGHGGLATLGGQSAAGDVAAQREALRALFGLVPALMPVTGV
jgi:hypothetical protein